jgi:hypothetical protein
MRVKMITLREIIGAAIGAAILIAMAAEADASPFLVCTPVPATSPQPTSYTIQGLPAVNVAVPATKNADGSVQLHYDLTGLAVGSYTVTATATNLWGTSPASVPFTFSSALPAAPMSLSVSPL